MTIKDAVKAAIAAMPGNKPFEIDDIGAVPHEDGHNTQDNVDVLSRKQISRAIRDLPHVQRDGKGNYRVKGRRVPQQN